MEVALETWARFSASLLDLRNDEIDVPRSDAVPPFSIDILICVDAL